MDECEISKKRDIIGCMNKHCKHRDSPNYNAHLNRMSPNSTPLHIHHVQRHIKIKSPINCMSLRSAIDELRKCVVLCWDCHRLIHSRRKNEVVIYKNLEYCQLFLHKSFYETEQDPLPPGRTAKFMRIRLKNKAIRRSCFKPGVKTRWCRRCNYLKEVSNFRIWSNGNWSNICKGCQK